MRRTYSSPGLCSSCSVISSPMRTQFSSMPSGSMISISRRRCSGSGSLTGCFLSCSCFFRLYVMISCAACLMISSSSGRTSIPSKSILRCEGSWGIKRSLCGFQNLRLYQANWSAEFLDQLVFFFDNLFLIF